MGFVQKLLGSPSDRAVKKLLPTVEEINELEPEFQELTLEQLGAVTAEFRTRLAGGESLDDLLPEAFAAVREASRRTIGLRHFDVQLIGGMVLHRGNIAEMRTGEGKTLVATLPTYLNALPGKGVHLVTVNDYLARRDVQWMGPIYHALGLSVSSLQHEGSLLFDPTLPGDNPSLRHLRQVSRREAYGADITYGTNHEFGFDYLRDNMAVDASQISQRDLHYAIVDEVDYILIDEARTPLIISGPAQEPTQTYGVVARMVPQLHLDQDYTVEEKHRTVSLTDQGISKIERLLSVDNLYSPDNFHLTHFVENALRALVHYRRDREYVVRDGSVIIVDEFTGRLMEGRRYADGLHQSIEAKEGLRVQQESVTYASITLQNYFRMYEKLAGMTGTAMTEAEEFQGIYRLEPVTIPTHRDMVREDATDFVYKSEAGKWQAAANEIQERHNAGQPVLVGTTSIENSERVADLLKKRGIPHQVLNAKQHEHEAVIIAQAGQRGAVTVATNMAGRGTDIILGGNPDGLLAEELRRASHTLDTAPPDLLEQARSTIMDRWQKEHDLIVALGGLHVLGTEKHEARRIDNQLRGRSGRQGDPGSSRFYVALDDDLMKRFGGDRIKGLMEWSGVSDDSPFESNMVSKAIGTAQTKVEAFHFEMRKHLVEYDEVINQHRRIVYEDRRRILLGEDLRLKVLSLIEREIQLLLETYLTGKDPEDWDLEPLANELRTYFPLSDELQPAELELLSRAEIEDRLRDYANALYQQREDAIGPNEMRRLERLVMLRIIDSHWVVHLTAMENLRQGIGLHAYGQRDPLVTYRTEAHQKFQEVQAAIQHDIAASIYHVSLMTEQPGALRRAPAARAVKPSPMAAMAGRAQTAAGGRPTGSRKIGRNDPCPCGSGKKYKRCHGSGA